MESLRTLLRPRGAAPIPQWREVLDDQKEADSTESVDLLVKALHYTFKRFAVDTAQLPSPATVAAAADPDAVANLYLRAVTVPGLSRSDQDRLDRIYNIDAFRRLLVLDRHRVLVDWVKNRFRALLILEHEPQMESLPALAPRHFRFLVLPPDASRDEYVRTLAQSDIFVEHGLPLPVRSGIAAKLYDVYRPSTRAARQRVVVEFVRQTAIETQVARLYKASLRTPLNSRSLNVPNAQSGFGRKASEESHQPANPLRMNRPLAPHANVPPSPVSSASSSQASLATSTTWSTSTANTSKPSSGGSHVKISIVQPADADSGSAPRLRMKSSSQTLRPGTTPSIPPFGVAAGIGGGSMTEAGRKQMLTQARMAVRSRLDREQAMIEYERMA